MPCAARFRRVSPSAARSRARADTAKSPCWSVPQVSAKRPLSPSSPPSTRWTTDRKVALLSLDTYRIGAIQQLRTYAELMNLPLLTATNTDEVADALEQFAGYDLVLIDTIGRGQRDEEHLQEMRQALLPVKGVVYLTLSATADSATLLDAAQRFRLFEPDASDSHQAGRSGARGQLRQPRAARLAAVRLLHNRAARARRHHARRRARAHLRRTARHHRMRHRPQTP
jgi:CheY-like chemotaxis protein